MNTPSVYLIANWLSMWAYYYYKNSTANLLYEFGKFILVVSLFLF